MKYSKKEFAAHCGILTKELSVYIGRKKVVVVKDEIDSLNPVNDLFVKKMLAKKPKEAADPEKHESEKRQPLIPKEENPLVELNRQKGSLEIRQKQNSLQLQQMEIDKKRGELVPTALIRNLIVQHSESLKAAFADISDNLLEIMAQKKGFTREEISDLRAQNRRLINLSVDTTVLNSKKRMGTIVEEYSKKRGVGEHD